MNHLVIGIPTFKRPEMLAKLVSSIYQCNIDRKLVKTVDLIVIDNDVEKSAEQTSAQLKRDCPEHFSFNYYNFTTKGLSNVRNEILAKAISINPDFMIFVDDDEYVTQEWINKLMESAVKHDADIVQGPNIPVFENDIADSISIWFSYLDFEDDKKIFDLETNNVLIKTQFVTDNNLSFDARFNTTGGEDTFFGVQAMKAGAKNFWSKKAIVYETIPRKRATLKWLLKRKYRGATTYSYILKLNRNYKMLLKKVLTSVFYVSVGVLTLPSILIPFQKRYWSLFAISNGLGGLAGMFSLTYEEYR